MTIEEGTGPFNISEEMDSLAASWEGEEEGTAGAAGLGVEASSEGEEEGGAEGTDRPTLESFQAGEYETEEEMLEAARKLPEAEGLSEEELKELIGGESGEAPQVIEGVTLMDAEGKPLDLSTATASDLLRAKFHYKADKKDQVADLSQLVRRAQWGHLNQTRLHDLMQTSRRAEKQIDDLRTETGVMQQERDFIEAAIMEDLAGDSTKLDQLRDELQKAQKEEGATPGSSVEEERARLEAEKAALAAGKLWDTEIAPVVEQLATAYGLEQDGIATAISQMIEETPSLDSAKLQDILQNRIVEEIELAGYQRKQEPKVALKKALAAVQFKKRVNGAPPASQPGGTSPSELQSTVPDFKSAADMKKWLQS